MDLIFLYNNLRYNCDKIVIKSMEEQGNRWTEWKEMGFKILL